MKSVSYDPSNGNISGEFKTPQDGKTEFTSSGPNDDLQPAELKNLEGAGRRRQVRPRELEPAHRHPALGAPARPHHRLLRLDEPARAGPDGRGHEHRPQPGEGLRRREAEDHVLATSPATSR